jgi:hypothetical protein
MFIPLFIALFVERSVLLIMEVKGFVALSAEGRAGMETFVGEVTELSPETYKNPTYNRAKNNITPTRAYGPIFFN